MPKQKFQGKKFALAGKLPVKRDFAKQLIEMEGGELVDDVSANLDYLVTGATRTGAPSAAEKKAGQLNQNKGAAIQILADSDFLALFAPTPDEVIAMLKGGEAGLKRLALLCSRQWLNGGLTMLVPMPDLNDADLRGIKPGRFGAFLVGMNLDRADLRDADLSHTWVPPLDSAQLDGACLVGTTFRQLHGCSLKGADLSQAKLFGDCSGSDFTEAKLSGVVSHQLIAANALFKQADVHGATLENSRLMSADLSGADLTEAKLSRCDLTGAQCVGTKFLHADLFHAKLVNTDLRDADLRYVNLAEADLSGATVDGADFEGATLTGAKLDGLDQTKAKGLDPSQSSQKGSKGANIQKLESIVKQAQRVKVSTTIDLGPQGLVSVDIDAGKFGTHSHYALHKGGIPTVSWGHGASMGDCMVQSANRWSAGNLRMDSIKVMASKAPMGGKELKNLVLAAWCEAYGLEAPSEESIKKKLATQKAGQQQLREQLLAELRLGAPGVAQWNARKLEERQRAGHFRKIDLAKMELPNVKLGHLDFQKASFAGANLAKADFTKSILTQVNFQASNLDGADLALSKCQSTDFRGAQLTGCNLRSAGFRKADFRDADLTGSELHYSDLCGADFSAANLEGVTFEYTKFDEHTKFPKGYKLPEGLRWTGAGPDPRIVRKKAKKPAGPLDVEAFMKELEKHADAAKLSKALAMLKADRFKLYAQVEDDYLTGVVKSQSDADLVYSCRLAADGSYACCTQNLNVCGGLRGSLCKHLLVLIIGLSKGNQLDPTTVYDWIENSRMQKPALDKDLMSETFLRYKGAEAGEVDWRPTETIPEDYYAM